MFGFFKKNTREDVVLALYRRTADASRAPWLYLAPQIPDTVEGRLESLMLHALLVIRRLQALPEPAPAVAQDFVDTLFKHVDHGLRELGVGDTSVPKRMKKIAQNFYGRVQAYAEPLDRDDAAALAEAFRRNIPGVVAEPLVAYVKASEAALAGQSLDALLGSDALFPQPPAG